MNTRWPTLVLASLAAPVAAQVPESVDPALLPNYVVVRPGLASAGRPSGEGLRRLKALGFRTVIDLRASSEEGVAQDRAFLVAQGLQHHHVPVTAASLNDDDVDAIRAVLDDPAAGPVLLHCASGNRVGAVWAVLRARAGTPIDAAIADGQRVGLRSQAMIEAARRVADPHAAADRP